MILNRTFGVVTVLLTLFLMPATNLQADISQGILDDGEFNLPTSGSDISNSAWALVSNRPDVTNLATQYEFSGAARSSGAAGTGGGLWYRPFEGREGGSNDPFAESVLTQNVNAPVDADYILSVDWAREEFFNATEWRITLDASVLGGQTSSTSFDLLTAPSIANGNFDQILASGGPNVANLYLSAIPTDAVFTVTVDFNGGQDVGGAQSGYLDNFNLRAVPEPSSTCFLLLSALGFLGVRRR